MLDTGGAGSITVSDFLTLGTASSYFNAGPTPVEAEGTIAAPAVIAGTDTTEFGTAPIARALFDLDAVEIAYPTLDPGSRYDIFLTYVNTDNTAGAGGNQQRLLAGSPAVEVHPTFELPTSPGCSASWCRRRRMRAARWICASRR